MKQKVYVKKPINIAITGKIGTGKTTVCNLLKKERFQVFESDKEIKKFLKKRSKSFNCENIFKTNKNLLNSEGYINKKALSSHVFF